MDKELLRIVIIATGLIIIMGHVDLELFKKQKIARRPGCL